MNFSDTHSFSSRYSGKVLLAVIKLVFIFIAVAVFASSGFSVTSFSKIDRADVQHAYLNSSNVPKDTPQVGVVKGIVFNPSKPCAVVDETMVHVGDKIHDVVVVGIQSNAVEFAKDGLTWQQSVLDAPNAAWPNPVGDKSQPVK